jgi:hypothetical protein
MKLTNQIEYVENYIISKDIKWYELQVELTDHMVTSMEVLGKSGIGFHQVKQYIMRFGFKSIEKQRKRICKKNTGKYNGK